MTSILLVRHAHAPWSPDEMRSLSAEGAAAADRLAEQLTELPIGAVYSSPYRRAVETVAPLAARLELDVRELPELRERDLGSIGSLDFEQAVASTWVDFDFAHAGGESNRAARQRGVSAIRFLADRHPDEVVVAGTHGNLLALLLGAFDERVGFDFWRSLAFPDVVRLDLDPSGAGTFHRLDTGAP